MYFHVIYHNWHYSFIIDWLIGDCLQLKSDYENYAQLRYTLHYFLVTTLFSVTIQTVFAEASIVNLSFKNLVPINVHRHGLAYGRFIEDVENMTTSITIKMFVRTCTTIIAHMMLVDGYHLR